MRCRSYDTEGRRETADVSHHCHTILRMVRSMVVRGQTGKVYGRRRIDLRQASGADDDMTWLSKGCL